MDKNMQDYIRSLSSDYINLTLNYNTFEKLIQDIEIIIKSRSKSDTKVKKIKELLGALNEKQK